MAPSFCNEKVVLNSHMMKSGKTCVAPLLALEWLSGGMMGHVYPSSCPSHCSHCANVGFGLCFFTDHLRGKGFARRCVSELGQVQLTLQ